MDHASTGLFDARCYFFTKKSTRAIIRSHGEVLRESISIEMSHDDNDDKEIEYWGEGVSKKMNKDRDDDDDAWCLDACVCKQVQQKTLLS